MKHHYATLLIFFFFSVNGFRASEPNDTSVLVKRIAGATQNTERADALNKMAWLLRYSDTLRSFSYAYEALELGEKLDYPKGRGSALKTLGSLASLRGRYAEALASYEKAATIFHETENRVEEGNLYNLQGLTYWEQGSYPQAVAAYRHADELFRQENDRQGRAIVLNNLGIIYYELSQYDLSLEAYLQALGITDALGDHERDADLYNNIGLIYAAQKQYRKAIGFYRKAIDALKYAHVNSPGRNLTNMGVAYFELKELDSSLYYHRKALQAFEAINEQASIGRAYLNIGTVLLEKREPDEAGNYYRQALVIEQRVGDRRGELIILEELGKWYVQMGNDAEAEQVLNRALLISKELDEIFRRLTITEALSGIFERRGDTEKAFELIKEHAALKKRYMDEISRDKLLSLQMRYELGKQDQEKAVLKRQTEEQARRKKWFRAAAIFVLLVGAVLLVRQRHRHVREKRRKEAEVKARTTEKRELELEIEELEVEMAQNRHALLLYVRKLAERNEEKLSEEARGAAMSFPDPETYRQLAEARLLTDEDWDEFKRLFRQVYPVFFPALLHEFPAITQAEIRLAALVVLKLGTREIAAVLAISPESVKKLRQRLRKRLLLNTPADLQAFLNRFLTVEK